MSGKFYDPYYEDDRVKPHLRGATKASLAKEIISQYRLFPWESIEMICREKGIQYRTFFRWVKTDEAIKKDYEAALKERRTHKVQPIAEEAMALPYRTLVGSADIKEEVETVRYDENGKEKGRTVKYIKKKRPLHYKEMLFLLTNLVKEEFQWKPEPIKEEKPEENHMKTWHIWPVSCEDEEDCPNCNDEDDDEEDSEAGGSNNSNSPTLKVHAQRDTDSSYQMQPDAGCPPLAGVGGGPSDEPQMREAKAPKAAEARPERIPLWRGIKGEDSSAISHNTPPKNVRLRHDISPSNLTSTYPLNYTVNKGFTISSPLPTNSKNFQKNTTQPDIFHLKSNTDSTLFRTGLPELNIPDHPLPPPAGDIARPWQFLN